MAVLIMILKLIRAASYLIFAPSPATQKGKITPGDALLVTKDATAAFGWAALLVLLAKAFGADLSGDEAQKVVEAILIVWPLIVAIVSTIIRWFQDSKPKPLPTPPPNPFPPNGIRSDKPQGFIPSTEADPSNVRGIGRKMDFPDYVQVKPDSVLSEPDSQGFKPGESEKHDYDFESRPPGGGPFGPKK